MTIIPDGMGQGPVLQEAMRELEAAIHDARVAFDCIGLGELDRASTSALTARVAIDAAVTALQAAQSQSPLGGGDDLGPGDHILRLRAVPFGRQLRGNDGDYLVLSPTEDGLTLGFQRVADAKLGKNRLHLDVMVDDLDQATPRSSGLAAAGSSREPPATSTNSGGAAWQTPRATSSTSPS
jgi:Glyoxalase-like domain